MKSKKDLWVERSYILTHTLIGIVVGGHAVAEYVPLEILSQGCPGCKGNQNNQ